MSTDQSPQPRCDHCAEVIGVFERAVWRLDDNSEIHGGILEPPALDDGRRIVTLLHAACAEKRDNGHTGTSAREPDERESGVTSVSAGSSTPEPSASSRSASG